MSCLVGVQVREIERLRSREYLPVCSAPLWDGVFLDYHYYRVEDGYRNPRRAPASEVEMVQRT